MKRKIFLLILFTILVSNISFAAAGGCTGEQTIHIITKMINDDFGTLTPWNFLIFIEPNYGDGWPNECIVGEGELIIPLSPGYYNVWEAGQEGYKISYSEGCSGLIHEGQNKTCVITNNDPELPEHKGKWCYQEFANQSTECGGLSTGNYSFINFTSEQPNNFWLDGDWHFFTFVYAEGNTGQHAVEAEYFVNYTKPERALPTSVFKIKESTDGYIARVTDAAYPIPKKCFNQEILSFRLTTPINNTIAWCWSGKNWTPVRTMEIIDDWVGINDEAIIWDMRK